MASTMIRTQEQISAIFENRHKVAYDQMDLDAIFCPKPSAKKIPGNETQQYLSSNCEYRINPITDEKPEYVDFRFEGPVLYSKFGVTQMVDKDRGTTSYSIYSPLPQSDENIAFFTHTTLDSLHDRMCEYAYEYRQVIGKPQLTKEGAKSMIPQLYKYKKDKATNEYYYDRDPHIYSRLNMTGDRTVFVGMDGKVIPFYKLESVEMKYVPVYSLGFYCGGMGISFPMKMVEAIVLYYRKSNATSSQADTIEKYKDEFMEEYKRSLEAMSKMALNDGLKDNESTLGDIQQNALPPPRDQNVGNSDQESLTQGNTQPLPQSRSIRQLK